MAIGCSQRVPSIKADMRVLCHQRIVMETFILCCIRDDEGVIPEDGVTTK